MAHGPFVHQDIHFWHGGISFHMGLDSWPVADRQCDRWVLSPDDEWIARPNFIAATMQLPLPEGAELTMGVTPTSSERQMVILQGNEGELIRPATELALRRYWDGQRLRTFKHAKARELIALFLYELAQRAQIQSFYRCNGTPINYHRYLPTG